jgi:exodeoxyribonuclease VII small subunit
MSKTVTPVEKLTYEQALNELEGITQKLESQALELEETLTLFERGKALIQRCQTLLEKAELKVSQLSDVSASDEEQE